jgi:LysM domain.
MFKNKVSKEEAMRQITYGNQKQQFENKRTYGRIVRKQKSKKLGLRGLLLLILVFLAFFAGRASVARAGEMANHSEAYRYRSVKIRMGDTLSDFATRYNQGLYRSDELYVEELCRVNGIDETTRLYPGCFLTVLEPVEEKIAEE